MIAGVTRLSQMACSSLSTSCFAAAQAEGESMSDTKRACLLYRASQKRIAREYLIRARHELDTELNRLRKLQQQE